MKESHAVFIVGVLIDLKMDGVLFVRSLKSEEDRISFQSHQEPRPSETDFNVNITVRPGQLLVERPVYWCQEEPLSCRHGIVSTQNNVTHSHKTSLMSLGPIRVRSREAEDSDYVHHQSLRTTTTGRNLPIF